MNDGYNEFGMDERKFRQCNTNCVNYNHYSLTQLICTSLFLSQCIILPILIFGFITKRIQQNNTFILPHLIKYIVPT